jgi:hypothetical protein
LSIDVHVGTSARRGELEKFYHDLYRSYIKAMDTIREGRKILKSEEKAFKRSWGISLDELENMYSPLAVDIIAILTAKIGKPPTKKYLKQAHGVKDPIYKSDLFKAAKQETYHYLTDIFKGKSKLWNDLLAHSLSSTITTATYWSLKYIQDSSEYDIYVKYNGLQTIFKRLLSNVEFWVRARPSDVERLVAEVTSPCTIASPTCTSPLRLKRVVLDKDNLRLKLVTEDGSTVEKGIDLTAHPLYVIAQAISTLNPDNPKVSAVKLSYLGAKDYNEEPVHMGIHTVGYDRLTGRIFYKKIFISLIFTDPLSPGHSNYYKKVNVMYVDDIRDLKDESPDALVLFKMVSNKYKGTSYPVLPPESVEVVDRVEVGPEAIRIDRSVHGGYVLVYTNENTGNVSTLGSVDSSLASKPLRMLFSTLDALRKRQETPKISSKVIREAVRRFAVKEGFTPRYAEQLGMIVSNLWKDLGFNVAEDIVKGVNIGTPPMVQALLVEPDSLQKLGNLLEGAVELDPGSVVMLKYHKYGYWKIVPHVEAGWSEVVLIGRGGRFLGSWDGSDALHVLGAPKKIYYKNRDSPLVLEYDGIVYVLTPVSHIGYRLSELVDEGKPAPREAVVKALERIIEDRIQAAKRSTLKAYTMTINITASNRRSVYYKVVEELANQKLIPPTWEEFKEIVRESGVLAKYGVVKESPDGFTLQVKIAPRTKQAIREKTLTLVRSAKLILLIEKYKSKEEAEPDQVMRRVAEEISKVRYRGLKVEYNDKNKLLEIRVHNEKVCINPDGDLVEC